MGKKSERFQEMIDESQELFDFMEELFESENLQYEKADKMVSDLYTKAVKLFRSLDVSFNAGDITAYVDRVISVNFDLSDKP